jgi:hypothetical protein
MIRYAGLALILQKSSLLERTAIFIPNGPNTQNTQCITHLSNRSLGLVQTKFLETLGLEENIVPQLKKMKE